MTEIFIGSQMNINEIGTVIVYVVNHISLRFAAIQQLLVNETDKKI
jgi:hypothetical protein